MEEMLRNSSLPSAAGSSGTVSGWATSFLDSFFATLALRLLEEVFWTIGMSLEINQDLTTTNKLTRHQRNSRRVRLG